MKESNKPAYGHTSGGNSLHKKKRKVKIVKNGEKVQKTDHFLRNPRIVHKLSKYIYLFVKILNL